MQLAEAAYGICDLLWLVDMRNPESAQMTALLRRFGPVVDIGRFPVADVARSVAQYAPDGITAHLDEGLMPAALIAAELGLPFFTPATAARLTDKIIQRDALAANGIDTPRHIAIGPGPARKVLAAAPPDLGWPAVLKPRAESGSHHTFLARDRDEVRHWLDALGDEREEMILEEYLSDDPAWSAPYADYVSVESVVSRSVIHHLVVTGRFPVAQAFRETGFVLPADISDSDRAAVFDLASRAVAALGITDGCLHTEIKFTSAGLQVIEVNGRVGGGIPEMLDQAAHFPLLATTFRVALGEELLLEAPVDCERIGFRFFLQPPAVIGSVTAIEGMNTLATHHAVQSISIHHNPGDHVDWRDGSRTYILAVVGEAHDHDEVREVWRAMAEEVTVSYVEDAPAVAKPVSRP